MSSKIESKHRAIVDCEQRRIRPLIVVACIVLWVHIPAPPRVCRPPNPYLILVRSDVSYVLALPNGFLFTCTLSSCLGWPRSSWIDCGCATGDSNDDSHSKSRSSRRNETRRYSKVMRCKPLIFSQVVLMVIRTPKLAGLRNASQPLDCKHDRSVVGCI